MKEGVESRTDLVVRMKKQSAKETRSRIGGRKRNFLRLTHEVLGQKKGWIMVIYTCVFGRGNKADASSNIDDCYVQEPII